MTGRRSADTNLAEIHEEMSELLDKQVNVQKESLKKLPGFTKAMKKCAMKMKAIKKKQLPHKNFCGERKHFIRLYQKIG